MFLQSYFPSLQTTSELFNFNFQGSPAFDYFIIETPEEAGWWIKEPPVMFAHDRQTSEISSKFVWLSS